MNLPTSITTSLKRLNSALDHLEAAAERRASEDSMRSNADEELAIMQDDRTRLAVDLDGALARSKTLLMANEEVSRRLERVSAVVRSVIGGLEPAGEKMGNS